jgi:hypothetical protein
MAKLSLIVAALLVPALSVSVATAAPKKKKPKKKPAKTEQVAPAPEAPAPIFDTKPDTSALQRVENGVSNYAPPDAPTPVITKQPDEPASKTTLTSADAPAPAPAADPAPAPITTKPADADVAPAAPKKRDALGEGVSVAPLADYGTSKVYGFGIGGRVGYTHSSHLYFGGAFNYHFGGSNGPYSYKLFYLGPEVGYNVAAGPVTVRPYLGGGVGSLRTTYHGTGYVSAAGGGAGVTQDYNGQSQTAFFWPGVTIFVPVTNEIALGADVRLFLAPGQDASAKTLANNGVLKFNDTSNTSTPTSTALAAGLTASYRF